MALQGVDAFLLDARRDQSIHRRLEQRPAVASHIAVIGAGGAGSRRGYQLIAEAERELGLNPRLCA
jgi:NADPH-dependent glutamate synthase beta subunit-like oxidoreductase